MMFEEIVYSLREGIKNAEKITEYFLQIHDRFLKIHCVDFAPTADMPLYSLKDLFRERIPADTDAESFYCFLKQSNELQAILPDPVNASKGRYVYNSEKGQMAVSVEFGFFSVYSVKYRETYIWICPDVQSVDGFVTHPFHMELSWWARRYVMCFLHSAAVGRNGQGVLISGAGGKGKSTLSLSSLLYGLDFLSDDYLMLSGDNSETKAYRLYSTGYLNDDVLMKLRAFQKEVCWRSESRQKNLISLDCFREHVVDELNIKAVIVPHIVHSEKPEIRRNRNIRQLIPLLASTSYQNRELRNKEVFQQMMKMMKNLPSYDMLLTDDLQSNAEYLGRRIGELIERAEG